MSLDAQIVEWQGKGYLSDFFLHILFALLKYCMFLPFWKFFFSLHCYMNPFQPVHKMEERLKAKVQERNQIIADENQKLGALRSETECKLQCLEPRERKVEAMIEKVMCLF